MKRFFCLMMLLFVAVAAVGYFGLQPQGEVWAATALCDSDPVEAPYVTRDYDESTCETTGKLFGIFELERKEARPVVSHSVLLGGTPLGISLKLDGLMITAKSGVVTVDGTASPMDNVDVTFGDILTSVNGVSVDSAASISDILEASDGRATLEISRGSVKRTFEVQAVRDALTSRYKLGLLLQESVDGIGTLTYIDPTNARFGCLGHPIAVYENVPVDIVYGTAYPAYITGAEKGKVGKAGQLEGSFSRADGPVAVIEKNNKYGNFGYYTDTEVDLPEIDVASREEVTPGDAQIYSTVIGNEPELYDIEIIKVERQDSPDDKSMVIRVTDKELISLTGGIVQGMSGSPIIQNGKLVGAVTHVFTSDPTKGFGIFIDWMLMQ